MSPNESPRSPQLDVESAVRERYGAAARAPEAALCCAVSYPAHLLEAIPAEVIEKDYGCGDPTRYIAEGETVLDLGSGSGKACFLAAQVVGPQGRVIGVDVNDDMLELARRSAPVVAERIGHANVEFRKGRIQDLTLDRELVDAWLRKHPIACDADLTRFEAYTEEIRAAQPLVATDSIDVVVSNCVLNLVRPSDKRALFNEIFRVLRKGGRAVISDIVCDEDVPEALRQDPDLWSGCVSGAFREDLFLSAFEQAGFHGMTVLERQAEPWQTVAGIEFRSLTVAAWKGKQGICLDQGHALVYRGPFSRVLDDDDHEYERGVRTAVCAKTFGLFRQAPYAEHFDEVVPRVLVPLDEAPEFPCTGGALIRHPRQTKGEDYRLTAAGGDCCAPEGGGSSSCC